MFVYTPMHLKDVRGRNCELKMLTRLHCQSCIFIGSRWGEVPCLSMAVSALFQFIVTDKPWKLVIRKIVSRLIVSYYCTRSIDGYLAITT